MSAPTSVIRLCVQSDALLYLRSRALLNGTPPPEQEGAIKELVTSTITAWHASAGADDMTADMVTGLAFWALQFVDWKSIAESIRP